MILGSKKAFSISRPQNKSQLASINNKRMLPIYGQILSRETAIERSSIDSSIPWPTNGNAMTSKL